MNKKFSVIFSIVILLTVTVVASIDLTQKADALKSKGTTTPKYGSDTKSIVCGDRLCSESPSESDKGKRGEDKGKRGEDKGTHGEDKGKHGEDKGKHGEDKGTHGEDKGTHGEDKGKQDKTEMKQKHLQMLDDMKSMSKTEIIDSLKVMMSEHRNMVIDKMSQMEKQELLDHMDKMIDKMSKMDTKHMDMKKSHGEKNPLYNEMLNPSQIEYPNIVGFNDLHIEAIRHLAPHGDDSKLEVIVHHHCKVYDDMTAACLLFPTGMGDQDKPYGMEYIITSEQFKELSEDEKKYWHYHLTELPRAQANLPDLTAEELAPLQPVLEETYGKVFYFWETDDKYPIGEPTVLVIQDLPE